MTKGKSDSSPIVWERELLQSPAYMSLTGKSPQVLGLFMARRRLKQDKTRRDRWVITNNGEIVFTYTEAETEWGLSRSQFQRALRQLSDFGFIDVAFRGTGLHGSSNRYSISTRWRKWGTERFEPPAVLKKNNSMGFKKGHDPFGKQSPRLALLTGTPW